MKRSFLLVIALVIGLFTKSQTATITGNVLVVINSVDNKADAGAEVRLLDLNKPYATNPGYNNKDNQVSTSCDIEGNFTLKHVPEGKYVLYVSSKFSIADPYNVYSSLLDISDAIKTITNFDISTHRPDIQHSIDSLVKVIIKLGDEKKYGKMKKVNEATKKKVNEFISSFPAGVQLYLSIYSGETMNKYFKQIEVKPGVDENYAIKFEQTI